VVSLIHGRGVISKGFEIIVKKNHNCIVVSVYISANGDILKKLKRIVGAPLGAIVSEPCLSR